MKLITILVTCILLEVVFADLLKNVDFELPPSNWRANSTSPFFSLDENSTIPGWTFEGSIQYATAGVNLSLPGNGHALLLGQGGKINQTFTTNGDQISYLITFTLAIGGHNCQSNASLVISAPDSSAQFSFTQKYGRELWEVYGHQLGNWGDGESVNLVLESQVVDTGPNSTCWLLVDNLLMNTIGKLTQDNSIEISILDS